MPKFTGDWIHNSFLLEPTPAQIDLPMIPPPSDVTVGASKWAHGTLTIDTADSTKAKLVFVPGVELAITLSFEKQGELTVFRATGRGGPGPLAGVLYELMGWANVDANDEVLSISGAIIGVSGNGTSGPRNGLGGADLGTVGHFRLIAK